MPVYEYKGQHYELADGLSNEQALAKIKAHLGETVEKPIVKQQPETVQQQVEAPITSGFLMGLKDPISGGAVLLPKGLEALTSLGGYAPNVVSQFFGKEAARVAAMNKAEEEAYQQQRQAQSTEPVGTDWSRIAGNVVNPANLAVGMRAANLSATPLKQALLSGAATSTLQPSTTTEDYWSEKAKEAALGGVTGVVGGALSKGAGKVLNPITTKAEQTMRDLGVTLTPGQLMGVQGKKIEEFAENIPLVGKFISNARDRQLYQFNKAVINKALDKVGTQLPEDVIGRDAVAAARDIVSKQYDDVLSKIDFTLDPTVTAALGNIVKTSKLPGAAQKQELNDLIDTYIYQQIPVNTQGVGNINGQAYKSIESDVLKKIRSLRSSSMDSERTLGEELGRALDVFKSAMRSQNQAESSVLRRIDSAYGDLMVMEHAAANAGATNGVFTPKHYQAAVKAKDSSRSKSAYAAGKARGQDVSEAAIETIQPEVNSTVAGRLAMGGTGAYAAYQNPAVAGAAIIGSAAMYSPQGLKVMEALFTKRPDIARKIGAILTSRASKEGSITAAEIMNELNRQ